MGKFENKVVTIHDYKRTFRCLSNRLERESIPVFDLPTTHRTFQKNENYNDFRDYYLRFRRIEYCLQQNHQKLRSNLGQSRTEQLLSHPKCERLIAYWLARTRRPVYI